MQAFAPCRLDFEEIGGKTCTFAGISLSTATFMLKACIFAVLAPYLGTSHEYHPWSHSSSRIYRFNDHSARIRITAQTDVAQVRPFQQRLRGECQTDHETVKDESVLQKLRVHRDRNDLSREKGNHQTEHDLEPPNLYEYEGKQSDKELKRKVNHDAY